MSDPRGEGGAVIAMSGVTKAYRRPIFGGGEVIPVLKAAGLSVAPCERVAIQGESGVGKTTILNLLGGIDRPDAGTLSHRGRPIPAGAGERARWRRLHVGFIFQFHGLLAELTALENVSLAGLIAGGPRRDTDLAARSLLTELGLGERLKHHPDELSGGEQQRVAIARALVKRPDLVLADEPTGNLDPRTGDRVLELLVELQREQRFALVVATHSERLAARCHRILHVNDARLVPVPNCEQNLR
ncbi:MAG: ABC transporter ATP-binding protein [Acidobacteriota bacterium]|nr:ABC transporter ATP-binding protein [Acidobacteriota bacterium]